MNDPMDPNQLATMREDIDDQPPANPRPVPFGLVVELLSAHDYWQAIGGDMLAECANLRARAEQAEKREVELVAMVAEQRRQRDENSRVTGWASALAMAKERDDARRIACGSEDAETVQEQARRANLRGWGYLYPEEPAAVVGEPALDRCKGGCQDDSGRKVADCRVCGEMSLHECIGLVEP